MVSTGEVVGAMAATDWARFPKASECYGAGHIRSVSAASGRRQLWSRAAVVRLQKTGSKQLNLRATIKGTDFPARRPSYEEKPQKIDGQAMFLQEIRKRT